MCDVECVMYDVDVLCVVCVVFVCCVMSVVCDVWWEMWCVMRDVMCAFEKKNLKFFLLIFQKNSEITLIFGSFKDNPFWLYWWCQLYDATYYIFNLDIKYHNSYHTSHITYHTRIRHTSHTTHLTSYHISLCITHLTYITHHTSHITHHITQHITITHNTYFPHITQHTHYIIYIPYKTAPHIHGTLDTTTQPIIRLLITESVSFFRKNCTSANFPKPVSPGTECCNM